MWQVVYTIIICLLIFLFLYTGLSKLLHLEGFRADMQNQVFPLDWVPYITAGIPAAEIAAAVLLCFSRTRLAGLLLSLMLISAFTIYTILVLNGVFSRVPCSCGGVIRQLDWTQHFYFNMFFTIATILALIIFTRKPGEAENPGNKE